MNVGKPGKEQGGAPPGGRGKEAAGPDGSISWGVRRGEIQPMTGAESVCVACAFRVYMFSLQTLYVVL